jgi:NTE family protein
MRRKNQDMFKDRIMAKKIVLLLQGGGALGAFQCGVWKVLAPFIRENGHELIAVAGASMGAVNAGLIARHCHDADGGDSVLQDFWRNALATPPVPFFPFPGSYWQSWNGLLTGLLFGNRGLFHPAYQHWNPIGELFRFRMPIYQTDDAERTLASTFGEYYGTSPLLAVGVTDVESGEGILFDSASRAITPKMLAASIAIPVLFSPIEIEGRHYWDFEMRSNTLLPNLFEYLRKTLPRPDAPDEYLYIVVDMLAADGDRVPTSSMESLYRFMNIILGDKLKYDRRAFEVGNAYLDAMERIHGLIDENDDSPLAAAIKEEYKNAVADRLGHAEFLHIGRRHFEYEHISRDFDHSPQYIARLIEQGIENALAAIDEYRESRRLGRVAATDAFDHTHRKTDDGTRESSSRSV